MPSSEDIEHQRNLLKIHRRNLAHLVSQFNLQGGAAHATPVVVNGMDEARQQIKRIKAILRGWGVAVEDHPDDEPALASAQSSTQPIPSPSGPVYNFYGDVHGSAIGTNGGTTMSAFDQRGWNVSGGNIYNIARDLNMSQNPTNDELVAALKRLQEEIGKVQDLPADEADDVKSNVDAAVKAVDKAEPNKNRAAEKLAAAKEILDKLGAAVPSALALGSLIGQALKGLGVGG